MSPVHSADTLWVQNFVEIALSRKVYDISALLHFTQKFKMASKSCGKAIFCLKSPVGPSHNLRDKNFVEITLSRSVSAISVFTFHAEIQNGLEKWWESDFCEKLPVHSGHPGGGKF